MRLGYSKPVGHLALPDKGRPAISGSPALAPFQLRYFQPAQKQDQLSYPKGFIPADPDLELSLQFRPVTPVRFLYDLHQRLTPNNKNSFPGVGFFFNGGDQPNRLVDNQPPGALIPLSCQALGPFLEESELKSFQKRLDGLGLTARPQTRYHREQVGYTVLLQPMDYEQASQIKRKLEKENITASFIGTGNTLSLGAFRDKSRAENTLVRAQALGLDPRIEPGYAKRSTYWLVIQERDSQDESLSELSREYSDLRVENMACP